MSTADTTGATIRAIDVHLARGLLRPARRLAILAGGITAHGDEALARAFFVAALARGADAAVLGEIVLQTHLFAGYPRTINALVALRATGAAPPGAVEPTPPRTGEIPHPYRARGEALCRRIYGPNYEALRANIRGLHPDLDAWMVDEGYGRVLGRDGVDVVTRELAALTALVVLDVPRQVRAHLHGALNVGAGPSEIDETLAQAAVVADEPALERAHALWRLIPANRVRDRRS